MLFNSLQFVIFFASITGFYFAVPSRFRWIVLLIGSYVFYMFWNIWFVLVLVLCTLVTYSTAIGLERASTAKQKKIFLLISILVNLGLLFVFKYLGFVNESLRTLFSTIGWACHIPYLKIVLAVGISFYSLQALSYSFDVYLGKQLAERHLGIFAVYLAFFPKLISGPIERGSNLIPQLWKQHDFNPTLISSGISLLIWGLFKKMVIADRLAIYVDMVFAHPQDYYGLSLMLATLFFTLQIYCDFSGYTDIAIGCGRILGIELTQNFNFPYLARSIQDFWRRWHISLTTWFRDYLYIPLGGNRVRVPRWYVNILIVFVFSGLWHGANWTFVCWGVLHGFYYLFGRATAPARARTRKLLGVDGPLLKVLQVSVTFGLVSLAWVFFRANSLQDAFYVIRHMFVDIAAPLRYGPSQFTTIATAILASVFIALELIRYTLKSRRILLGSSMPFFLKCPVYVSALILIFLFGVSGTEFIYFHF